VRVLADGQTDTHTHTQTQTDFIICPILYAIAMGQIITLKGVYFGIFGRLDVRRNGQLREARLGQLIPLRARVTNAHDKMFTRSC